MTPISPEVTNHQQTTTKARSSVFPQEHRATNCQASYLDAQTQDPSGHPGFKMWPTSAH